MSEPLYGQCVRCGGNLTNGHKCWPPLAQPKPPMIDLDGIRERDRLAYMPNANAIHPTGSIADRRALLAYIDELQRANDALREAEGKCI